MNAELIPQIIAAVVGSAAVVGVLVTILQGVLKRKNKRQ